MGLRDRIGQWMIGGSRASTEAIRLEPSSSMWWGPGIGNQPAHDVLMRESKGTADTAIRAIANRVMSLDPLVKVQRRDTTGTLVSETLDDHRLKRLLDNPHPDFRRGQMLRLIAQNLVTVGEAHLLKVGNGLGVPVQLDPMYPHRIRPIVDRNTIEGYIVIDADGREQLVDRDAIIRFWFPDPENLFGAEGYLGPNAIHTDAATFAGQHLRHHYETDATPKMLIKADKDSDAPSPAQKEQWLADWQRYHRRHGHDAGLPAWLPPGFDAVLQQMATGAEMEPLLDYWDRQQLRNFGVPRSVLGEVVSGDRSSAETNQYVMDLHTILPIAQVIEDGLTYGLAKDFDQRLVVEFDEFVNRDKEFDLKQEQSDLVYKVRSVNQILEDRELDLVEWGEWPIGTLADRPYTGEDPMDGFVGEDDPSALGDPQEPEPDLEGEVPAGDIDTGESDPGRSRSEDWEPIQSAWQRQVMYERLYGSAMMLEMRRIFRAQRLSVQKRIRDPRARISIDSIFDIDEWVDLFNERVLPLYYDIVQRAGAEALASVGLPTQDFLFTDTAAQLVRSEGAQLVTRTGRTTKQRLATAIAAGVEEGEAIEKIRKRVDAVFKGRERDSRTIARTEVHKATQAAQQEGWRQSGVVIGKRWNTALDASVRDTHVPMENVLVALNEQFMVPAPMGGFEMADGPGSRGLSAGNVINCRCFATPARSVGGAE